MKLVSRSIYLEPTKRHDAYAMREERPQGLLSCFSAGGGRRLPLMVQMQDMEKNKKEKTKRSGIFSGPSLAYAER